MHGPGSRIFKTIGAITVAIILQLGLLPAAAQTQDHPDLKNSNLNGRGAGTNPGQSQAPVAHANPSITEGTAPLLVIFSSRGSYDPDGEIKNIQWNFGDGSIVQGTEVAHTFEQAGIYSVTMTTEDNDGLKTETQTRILVGLEPAQTMWVERLEIVPSKKHRVQAQVRIMDNQSRPVNGATVKAIWTDDTGAQRTLQTSTATDSEGMAIIESPIGRKTRNWSFEVLSVTHPQLKFVDKSESSGEKKDDPSSSQAGGV